MPGPAHWFGPHGTTGTWGKKRARAHARRRPSAVDNLANPSNNEIMPGTTQARLAGLLRLARTHRFSALPHRTLCHDSLPDFASLYVTIHTAGTTRTVIVRGGCKPRFTRVYRALAAAATVTSWGYMPIAWFIGAAEQGFCGVARRAPSPRQHLRGP